MNDNNVRKAAQALLDAEFPDFEHYEALRSALAAAPVAPEPAEPIAWIRCHPDGLYTNELLPNWQIERVRRESGAWVPLYTAPAPESADARDALLRKVQAWLTEDLKRYGGGSGAAAMLDDIDAALSQKGQ